MKVKNHRLFDGDDPVRFEATANRGGIVVPTYLIMHYTAGASLGSSVAHMQNPTAQASAHIVIGRDGEVVQMVPFNRVAWHAGVSNWAGISGLNKASLGIELDNWGVLTRQGGGWVSWKGAPIDDAEVLEATHKNGVPTAGWQTYTQAQIDAAIDVGLALNAKYGFLDVLGHDDISPGRKTDPGPAFPLSAVRSLILGRADDTDDRHETTVHLNIRSGPGAAHPKLEGSPLPPGTPVAILGERGLWRQVDVLAPVGEHQDVHGWVHGRFLRPVRGNAA